MNTVQLANQSNLSPTHISPRGLTRELHVDYGQATRWLNFLESKTGTNSELAEFCDILGDACWLARWKRENVIMEVDVAEIPSFLASLSSLPVDVTIDGASMVEEILTVLRT